MWWGWRRSRRSPARASSGMHALRTGHTFAAGKESARLGTALAATSMGALAIGALAVGALAIRSLAIKTARIQRLEIGEIVVGGRPFRVPA